MCRNVRIWGFFSMGFWVANVLTSGFFGGFIGFVCFFFFYAKSIPFSIFAGCRQIHIAKR